MYNNKKYLKIHEPKPEAQPHVMTVKELQLIELLKPAIKNKNLIRFWYSDTDSNTEDWRIVEPHLIGQTKYKAANIWLVAWFLPTTEQLIDGLEEKWGNYNLTEVDRVEILDRTFRNPRPMYNPKDKRMSTIYCAL